MARTKDLSIPQQHSSAWLFQTWASFIISVSAMGVGIVFLPVNGWVKGYLGMGLMFTVGSTISLSKTLRDVDESQNFAARVDSARVEKLIAEHHPLK